MHNFIPAGSSIRRGDFDNRGMDRDLACYVEYQSNPWPTPRELASDCEWIVPGTLDVGGQQ